MFKRVLIIAILMITWTSLCFAEEVLESGEHGYTLTLINAKTVNESENIIKARVKEVLSDKQDGYYVLTWVIQRNTRRVIERGHETFDKDGNFKGGVDLGNEIYPNKEAIEKIIRYIDREGK